MMTFPMRQFHLPQNLLVRREPTSFFLGSELKKGSGVLALAASPCLDVDDFLGDAEDYASMTLLRMAYRTSSAMELMPSFFMMAARCVSTVLTLMPSSADTALL